jgi:hypothetical protein
MAANFEKFFHPIAAVYDRPQIDAIEYSASEVSGNAAKRREMAEFVRRQRRPGAFIIGLDQLFPDQARMLDELTRQFCQPTAQVAESSPSVPSLTPTATVAPRNGDVLPSASQQGSSPDRSSSLSSSRPPPSSPAKAKPTTKTSLFGRYVNAACLQFTARKKLQLSQKRYANRNAILH